MVDDLGMASRGFFGIEVWSVSMERCTVSVLDGEAELHQVAVNVTRLFDAEIRRSSNGRGCGGSTPVLWQRFR